MKTFRLLAQKLPSVPVACFFIACFFSLFFAGCSSSNSTRSNKRSKIDPSRVEYLDREAVVKEEVASQATKFQVSQKEVGNLWKRTDLLGKTYLNTETKPKILKTYSPKGFHVRHFPAAAPNGMRNGYAYEIQVAKAQSKAKANVAVFAVNMRTGKQDQKSLMLAKNIARFLESGVFEREMLSQ